MFKTTGFFGFCQKYVKKGLFCSIILSSTPEAVNWVSFASVLLIYSLLGLRFYLKNFFLWGSFKQHLCSTQVWGGGGGWINNNYRVLNINLKAKKMEYSVASSYILLCHTDHYNVYKAHKYYTLKDNGVRGNLSRRQLLLFYLSYFH